ncbi:MAG TPA: DPP IV N-terminal domain-containing protein, partial [Cytophagaceae bacterium]
MRQKHFILYFILFFIPLTGIPQNPKITLEDIWVKGTFRPNYFMGVNWMKDNNFFTRIDYNPITNTANIIKSNIQSGESSVLVEGITLVPEGSDEPIQFDDYSFSPDERKLLISTETESIYRRSYKTHYYLYDLSSRKLTKLTKTNEKQAYATFSSDGQKVAFVRDNNLFYIDLKSNEEIQVTSDGKTNVIINGSTDWVYEEEFEFTRAFFWSPDSKYIAFYQFDESGVKEYT